MHFGRLDNDTAAGRVYRELKRRADMDVATMSVSELLCELCSPPGQGWVDGWELSQAARVTALSTRISEIRHQLAADPDRGERVEREQRGRGHWYRVVRNG